MNNISILLCKSVASKDKWGCLKGTKNKNESAYECAKESLWRVFYKCRYCFYLKTILNK